MPPSPSRGADLLRSCLSTSHLLIALSEVEEILEELLAGFGEDGFGMELHSFDLVAAVAHAHDDAIAGFGGDFEFARE